jgi:hypothetical protein
MSLQVLVEIENGGVMTAKEFRQIHDASGLTGSALGKALRISDANISNFRSGKRPVSRVLAHAMRNIHRIIIEQQPKGAG